MQSDLPTEEEIKEISTNVELCKQIKITNERLYAKYTLKKDIVPVTRWYLVDQENKQINIDVGDRIDYIDLEQSFDFKNNYLGTIRGIVADLEPKYLKLATPEKYYYLMGENNKIFGIYKPLDSSETNEIKNLPNQTYTIIFISILLILIIFGFMIL